MPERQRKRRRAPAPAPAAAPPLAPTVVGVGASAGGLGVLRTFFERVPQQSGLAFVVVVHLSPEYESHLADLLQPHVTMPVRQVAESVPLEPDHVYVIPPGANLDSIDTHLRLSALEQQRTRRAPIDHFFRTLAASHDRRAVGVILTGTGSDGALGIKEIKENSGLTVVQEPSEAEYDGMPRAAIATGMVDLVLPAAEIPDAILRFAHTQPHISVPEEGEEPEGEERRLLQKVFAQIRARTGRDFTPYKRSTILRRIQRRMQLSQTEQLEDYLARLREDGEELRALADDLLVTVTGFFRDPTVWQEIETEFVPALLEGKSAGDAVRVWSVGCATGEEAYSVAMLLVEEATRREMVPRIQIFATDLHEHSLARARLGFYPGDIEADVSPERLRRFFQKESGGYRVRKEIRELVIFAPHDVLNDPPFSRLDLVVCRNVLIYLQRDIQREVLEIFNYALQPDGLLLLGPSETVDGADLFHADSKRIAVYRKRNVGPPAVRLPVFPVVIHARRALARAGEAGETMPFGVMHAHMLERYGSPSMLLGPDDRVVHLSEHAGRYLVHPGGELTASAYRLVRNELRLELRGAVQTAREQHKGVRSAPVPVRLDGAQRLVVLDVRPGQEGEHEGFALVVFEEREPGVEQGDGAAAPAPAPELAKELEVSRERLQALVEEYEASQEEMRASTEELQSANEELHSTMEELETSKEELQSMNEELQTINQENRHKVEELAQLSSDLQNLLSATDIATLFLDRELRILRFTPKVGELFNVRPVDRGRPLSDLTHRLGYDDLLGDARTVLERLAPVEREVQDESGRWYLSRVLPYRSAEDRIEGVVLTLIDVTDRKAAQEERDRFFSLPLDLLAIGSSVTGRWLQVNPGMSQVLGWSERELLATPASELVQPPQPDEALVATDGKTGRVVQFEQEVRCKDGSYRWVEWRIETVPDHGVTYYAGRDVTSRHRADIALRESEARFRAIAELVPDLLWRADPDGSTAWYNQRWLEYTGQTLAEARDYGWLQVIHPDDREEALRRYQQAIETGEPLRQEQRIRRANGDYRWFLVQLRPVRDETGQITQWFGAATDIHQQRIALEAEKAARTEAEMARTEADVARDAAQRASRAKSQFLSTISHELRTPLTAVIGLSDLMGTEVLGPMTEKQRSTLARIKASAWHLVSILDEILTFSRSEAGKEDVQVGEMDVADVVREVVAMLGQEAQTRGLQLALTGAEGRLVAITDGGKLRQILINLIGNALKYTHEGRVDVEVASDDGQVEVRIRDTGPGIPGDRLEDIFEPFVQVDGSPTRTTGGTGLGLAICRKFARLLGGDVTVQSTFGAGSLFTLRLPRRLMQPSLVRH